MTARRLRAALLCLVLPALAGCGTSAAGHKPRLAQLPLVPGTSVTVRALRCDRGANPFCAWEVVVVGRTYQSSDALVTSERRRLKKLGWTSASGDTGQESSADSPGHKLRITYSTPLGDLKGIDLGWIHRSRQVTVALSRAMFDRAAAMSVMLEVGSG